MKIRFSNKTFNEKEYVTVTAPWKTASGQQATISLKKAIDMAAIYRKCGVGAFICDGKVISAKTAFKLAANGGKYHLVTEEDLDWATSLSKAIANADDELADEIAEALGAEYALRVGRHVYVPTYQGNLAPVQEAKTLDFLVRKGQAEIDTIQTAKTPFWKAQTILEAAGKVTEEDKLLMAEAFADLEGASKSMLLDVWARKNDPEYKTNRLVTEETSDKLYTFMELVADVNPGAFTATGYFNAPRKRDTELEREQELDDEIIASLTGKYGYSVFAKYAGRNIARPLVADLLADAARHKLGLKGELIEEERFAANFRADVVHDYIAKAKTAYKRRQFKNCLSLIAEAYEEGYQNNLLSPDAYSVHVMLQDELIPVLNRVDSQDTYETGIKIDQTVGTLVKYQKTYQEFFETLCNDFWYIYDRADSGDPRIYYWRNDAGKMYRTAFTQAFKDHTMYGPFKWAYIQDEVDEVCTRIYLGDARIKEDINTDGDMEEIDNYDGTYGVSYGDEISEITWDEEINPSMPF